MLLFHRKPATGFLVLLAAFLTIAARPGSVDDPEQAVRSGPTPGARMAAAETLGKRPGEKTVETLRAALASEKDPRVVDAILAALWKLGAPITDAQACKDLTGRSWEAVAASRLFDRWRERASLDDVFQAAVSMPDVPRALALLAISKDSRFATVKQDGARRAKLLDSTVDGLSRYKNLAPSTVKALHEALWDLSGANMATAIDAADRIGPKDARMAASNSLAQRNLADYLACRRPKQSMIGFLGAAVFALLMFQRRLRRAGALLVLSALGWTLWTWIARDARQLPPLALSLLTTSLISFLSAGFATLWAGLLPWDKVPTRAVRGFGRVGLSGALAGLVAAIVTLVTRSAGYFPVLDAGWDLYIEPLGALNLGILLGVVFALIDGWISGRHQDKALPEADPLAGL